MERLGSYEARKYDYLLSNDLVSLLEKWKIDHPNIYCNTKNISNVNFFVKMENKFPNDLFPQVLINIYGADYYNEILNMLFDNAIKEIINSQESSFSSNNNAVKDNDSIKAINGLKEKRRPLQDELDQLLKKGSKFSTAMIWLFPFSLLLVLPFALVNNSKIKQVVTQINKIDAQLDYQRTKL